VRDDSIWKKEISFRRKPKPPQAEKVEQPKPAEAPRRARLGRRQPEPLPPLPRPKVDPVPVARVEPEPQSGVESPPVLEPERVAEPQPEPVTEVLQPEPAEPGWNRPIGAPKEPEPVREFVIPEPKKHWWDKEVTRPKRAPSLPSRPAVPKPSLPKPSLSLPRLPKPALARGSADRIVGLKIGGSQIAAACIANNGSARLEQVARMPLASGIVSGGELRDPEALASALRSFFSEHKLPRKGVRLGIASSRIGVRSFEIAGIADEKQFVNAVRFRAQEALPIPLDEAVLDYRVLEERTGDDGEPIRRVLLVVAHRDLVERYVEACRLAGITLAGIDLEAFALLRALAAPADREGSALVAVSIGHERTTLAVSDGRVCEFTRVLEWGGWVLNVGLARALDSTPSEVELVKRNLSLDGGEPAEGLTLEQAAGAREAIRRGIESLARELVSSLTYYQSQPGSLGIGEVVVTGGTAKLGGLAQELERLLGVPVRVGDPLGRLEVAKPVDESELGSLAIAVGLGIED